MNKTFRLLQLINLLTNRRSVTLEMIKRTCDIPERTAYRYLNAISEVDIPVYFDKETRAYRLTQNPVSGIEDLSLGDAVLVIAALKLLKQFVNADYQTEIDKVLTKVLVRQEQPVEAALPIVDDLSSQVDSTSDLSAMLSSALVHTAIASNRRVHVTTTASDSGEPETARSLTIGSPALFFKDNWRIHERQRGDSEGAPMDNVRRVKIL